MTNERAAIPADGNHRARVLKTCYRSADFILKQKGKKKRTASITVTVLEACNLFIITPQNVDLISHHRRIVFLDRSALRK